MKQPLSLSGSAARCTWQSINDFSAICQSSCVVGSVSAFDRQSPDLSTQHLGLSTSLQSFHRQALHTS